MDPAPQVWLDAARFQARHSSSHVLALRLIELYSSIFFFLIICLMCELIKEINASVTRSNNKSYLLGDFLKKVGCASITIYYCPKWRPSSVIIKSLEIFVALVVDTKIVLRFKQIPYCNWPGFYTSKIVPGHSWHLKMYNLF